MCLDKHPLKEALKSEGITPILQPGHRLMPQALSPRRRERGCGTRNTPASPGYRLSKSVRSAKVVAVK
jgi:hypothetical protein